MNIEKRIGGYWGVFTQNLTQFRQESEFLTQPLEMAKSFLKRIGTKNDPDRENVLSFMAGNLAPYNFVDIVVQNLKFWTGGPLFSLIVEAAKFGNFR